MARQATDDGRRFIKVFDDHCKHAFYHSITNFQHYNTPLIQYQDWENFIEVAQFVFEKPWCLLLLSRYGVGMEQLLETRVQGTNTSVSWR